MFFDKIKENLKKTKEAFDVKMSNIFADKKDINEVIDEIEETYTSKINSPDVLSKLFDLQGRCEENLQFWEEIGNLD